MKLNINIDGKTFEVDVEVSESDHGTLPPAYPVGSAALSGSVAPAPVAVPVAALPAAAQKVANEEKVCRSPVSGIVVKINVQAGQSIEVGDSLVILEAMKMETNISAPIAGKVAAINVREGDNVQAGDVVIEFA